MDKNEAHDKPTETTGSTDIERYNTMGIAQATQGMNLQAIASFTRAIELDPNNPGYYYNRGIAYINENNENSLSLALEDFTHALKLRGDDADILNNRGNVYAMMGDLDAALADLTQCIALNPNQPEPYNNRAAVFAQRGDYMAAMLDFGKAVSIKPQYAEAHFNLARVNARVGNCDLASAHLKDALELEPTYKQVARAVGDFDECREHPGFTVKL